MFLRTLTLISCLLLVTSAFASSTPDKPTLRVYGPGGPHHVLEECASLFEARHGIDVEVIKAFPHTLAQKLPEDGDIYYGGAEYMLEEFHQENPGVLDIDTTEKLHPRRIGIIVRKGNPLGIRGLDDLKRDGVHLLDVHLEKMRGFHDLPHNGIGKILSFEFTGQQGFKAWHSKPELDAWVTYRSWYRLMQQDAEFIEIPGERALRYIPIALTERTEQPQKAKAFIDFLKSDEARQVFVEHGWD